MVMKKQWRSILVALMTIVGMVISGCGGGGGGATTPPPATTFSVSGTITSGGTPLAGVTVTLAGTGSTTTSTGSDGSYRFTGAQNGNYSITPSMAGHTFTPASKTVVISGADLTGQDFTANGGTVGTVQLPKTGLTTSSGSRDDGALQKGVAWPAQRFTVANGAVTDNLTGLIWLQNANCTATAGTTVKSSGLLAWQDALAWSNQLASGICGLSDGSTAGQWRLPNINELESLVDLSNAFSGAVALPTGHPFSSVQSAFYWSSSTIASTHDYAWGINMNGGPVGGRDGNLKNSSVHYVWPVRGGQ